MAKDNYNSRAYNFLVKSGYIDPQEVGFNSFNAQMSNPDFSRSVYSNFEDAQKKGKIGKLKPYDEFVSEFGVTATPVAPNQVADSGNMVAPQKTFPTPEELSQPVAPGQPLPNIGAPQVEQPEVTPTGLPTMESLEQGVQPMGGVPGSDPLANAPQQQFQWSGQQPTQPVVNPQADMPQTPEQGMAQQENINPADYAVSTLGSVESSFINQIGSELKGIAETGYSLDKKIVGALEGTPFEGGFRAPYSKPEDSWLYKAGQGMQDFTEENLYRNPELAGGIGDIVGQGLGSVGAIMATGGLNPSGGILKYGTKAMTNPQLIAYGAKQLFSAPMVRGAFAMVGQETDSARQLHRMANGMDKDAYVVERMALGEDKEDAGKAWETLRTKTEDEVAESMILPGMLAGVTEAIPLERLLVRLGKPAQNIIVNAFKQGGIQGAEEASQEVIQQTIINAGIGNAYNEAHRLTTGLLESAEGGGATGFVLGSVLTALVGKRANVKQRLQAGQISQKDAIAEMEDINKAEKLVQDKLQALDNVVNSKANEEIKALTDSPEAQTFFETNEPSLTNPLVTMPKEVETVLDKIADGVLISPESLHEAYKWANGSVKATLENQALTPAEKGATLNIFNGMLSDIDKANTEGQKFVEEVEAVTTETPATDSEAKLPEGQQPGTKPETPALDQAKQVREKLTVTEPVVATEVVIETTTEPVTAVTEPVQGTVTAETVATEPVVATEVVSGTPTAEAEATTTPQAGVVGAGVAKKDYEMSSSEYEAERQLSIPVFKKARQIANNILNWSGTNGLYEKYLNSIGVKPNEKWVYKDTSINDIEGYMRFLLKEKTDLFTQEDYNTYLKYKDFMDRGIDPDWQNHETRVSIALSEGKKVPSEVLKEYPELAKKQSLQVTPQAGSVVGGENRALADVESTAKALEGVDVNDLEKQIGVVYHGTKSDFTEFDESKMGGTDDGWYGKGFYFHSDKNRGGYGNIVKSAIVSLRNALKLPTDNAGKYLYDIVGKISGLDISFRDKSPISIIREIGADKFTQIAKDLGYDGVEANYSEGTKEIVSFDKDNIKIIDSKSISEAYHKAKQDGSNPELVQAVEAILAPETKTETAETTTTPVPQTEATETVATGIETTRQEAGQVATEDTEIQGSFTVTEPNATDVETITKIENATEKGRGLALAKPVNKWVKRAFETFEDLSARARKAGIYDGKTLKIGGKEIEVDTPAKFKAFLSNGGNFDAITEALKDVKDVKAEVKEQPIPEPTPKQVVDNAKEVFEDAKSSFVWPIGLNPKFKFDSRLPQKVKNLFNKYFRPRGLWTPELFKGKRMNEARMASQMERVKFKVRDLNNAIKESYPKGVKPADVERMNDFLQGNPVELPPALYKPLEAMREHIDELSRQMVEAGIIDDKLKPVFDRNMGVYTTRTYQIHNDPKAWIDYITNTPEGQELRNRAVNQLRQAEQGKADRMNKLADKAEEQGSNLMRMAELSETSDPERARKFEARAEALFRKAERLKKSANGILFNDKGQPTDFDAKIDAFLHAESMPLDVVSKGNVGAKDLGILKKRKDIDAVMRDLMGEEKDPLTNYVMSVAKMSALISNNQFLNEAKIQGLKDGTFTKEPRGKNIELVAPESSDTMNPLNGLYTTPEIADAFRQYNEIVNEQWYIDLILRLNGAVKLGKTLLSPQTHVRNFGSNFIIELANGSLDLSKGKQAGISQFETIFGLPEGESKTKYREYIERLTKLGVLDQGGNYRDMLSFYNDLKVGKFDYQKVIEPKIKKLGKATMGKIKEFYKAEDDFWKVYAFENERTVLKEAYPDKTDAELDAMAADKVLRTRVNYAMAPKIIQTIKRNPAFGTFPTFPAEMLRIGYNIPAVAVEEMKSGNAVMQKHGAKRMAMYMAALTLPLAANQFSSWWLDMDDEEEEARKKFLAPWAQNSTLIWLKGKDRYIDTGYSDAFNVLKKPAVAAFRGKDMLDGGMDAVLQFLEPFVSEEIGYKTISEIKNNRDEYDKSIYNENADWKTQLGQVLAYAGKKFEPGFISQGRRIYKGEKGELSEKGQKYNTGDEIVNTVLGQKVTTVDWDNAIMFKMKAEVEDIKDSNSFYNKKNRELPKSDKQGRKTEAEITNLAVKQNYDNLREYYEAAKKMGYTTLKIGTIMRESGVPAEMIAGVLTNKPYSNYLVITKDGNVIDRETQRRLK